MKHDILTRLADAYFACGEWRSGDDEDYEALNKQAVALLAAAQRDRRDLLHALQEIADRIDRGSGTASWTAREHTALADLIARVRQP